MPGAPCSRTRDPARGNAVVEIHNCYFNEGVVETDGVDLTVRTNFDLGAGGKLSNVLQLSHQLGYTIDGGVEQVGLQGFPETRAPRSEERRVGKECVSQCQSRRSPYH